VADGDRTAVGWEPGSAPQRTGKAIDFDREIRPIFSESCYPCHGPDENKRKANLRFDRKEGAFKELKDGKFAIVPGNLAQSQLVHRVTASNPDDKMPAAEFGPETDPAAN
jgi:hypothetical protein